MARDRLKVLFDLRQRAVEHARQALAVRVQAEAEVGNLIRRLDDTMRRDRDASMGDDDRFLDMAAARLIAGQTERLQAAGILSETERESAHARAVLVAARSAAEVVERLMADKAAAVRAGEAVREQHILDDIGRRKRLWR